MPVHDELLALCAEVHADGTKLTYDALLDRRGGGSRRDISKALRAWHKMRAHLVAEQALLLPDDIVAAGGEFAAKLWDMMSEGLSARLREVRMEADLIERDANEEISHLHKQIGDQHTEIEGLKAEIDRLGQKLLTSEAGRIPR